MFHLRGTQSNQTMKDSTEGSNSYAHLLWEKLNWYVDQFAQDSCQTKDEGYGELINLDFFLGGGQWCFVFQENQVLQVFKRVSSYNTPVKLDG